MHNFQTFLNVAVRLLIILILSFFLMRDSTTLFGIIKSNLNLIRRYPNWSYNEKMSFKTGEIFYNYTLFVKKNTPENAVILIPPQVYPWPQSGNNAYMRYFLYPRKLLNGSEPKDFENKELTYVLLVSGDNVAADELPKTTWPRIKVAAESVLIQVSPGDENSKAEINEGDYLPEKFPGKWGIIKL